MNLHDDKEIFSQILADAADNMGLSNIAIVEKDYFVTYDYCYSAQDGINMPKMLIKILNEEFFKSDYNEITQTLLFEDIPYTEAITVFNKIIESNMFNNGVAGHGIN